VYLLEQSVFFGEIYGFHSFVHANFAFDTKFAVDMIHMLFDGADTDIQSRSDLAVGETVNDECENFQFT
jgi:hypothetical protein